MISAFGVDHGISKAFKKLRPKLAAGLSDEAVLRHGSMNEKLRRHALQHRMAAGGQGHSLARRMTPEKREAFLGQQTKGKYTTPGTRLEVLRQNKSGAQGIYDRLGRQNRKKKVLP